MGSVWIERANTCGGRPHVRLSLPPGRYRPTGARPLRATVGVTPFTRGLPGSNIRGSTGFSCEGYGDSRMGVVVASEAKGESNKRRSGPEWARAAIAGGC